MTNDFIRLFDSDSDSSLRVQRAIEACGEVELLASWIRQFYYGNPGYSQQSPDQVPQCGELISDFEGIRRGIEPALGYPQDFANWVEQAREAVSTAVKAAEESQQALEDARQAANSARQAAGFSSDAGLGRHYRDVADNEYHNAMVFRSLAIACFAVGVAVGSVMVFLILAYHEENLSGQLLRLAVTLPIFGAAIYFSHESSGHRSVARRARECEVRLATLQGFIEPLDEVNSAQIREGVGRSILIGPALLASDGAGKGSDLGDMLDKLISLLSVARKGSD